MHHMFVSHYSLLDRSLCQAMGHVPVDLLPWIMILCTIFTAVPLPRYVVFQEPAVKVQDV